MTKEELIKECDNYILNYPNIHATIAEIMVDFYLLKSAQKLEENGK